jgi:steroid delta-isomerase-like uncharacterized protein
VEEQKITIANRLFQAWNSGDATAVLSFYHDDIIREDTGTRYQNKKEELRKIVTSYLIAFPDINYRIEKLIEHDDNIVVCWNASGHHKGKLMNIPPTGKYISFKGVSVLEINNGKISKVFYIWDEAGMLRQMGMLTEVRQAI